MNEEIIPAQLLTPDRKRLNPKLIEHFREWFILYSAPGTEVLNDQSVADFINVATRDNCERDDKRVAQLIASYAKSEESKANNTLTFPEFLDFYYDAASDPQRMDAVYQNLKNHNVRNDLKKLADIGNDTSFPKEEMPRYTLSANQIWFDTLFNLLDRNDDSSADVWDLVRMLNTNK